MQKVDDFIAQIKDIMQQYTQQYGTISYAFLTGGFLNCKYMQTQLSAMLNLISSVFIAQQPSTTVCSGATKIFDHKLTRNFKCDVIITIDGK